MDQRRLKAIVPAGEKATVDFKLECNAFQGRVAANAELVKDIVALANNGNRTSYLLIGIGDDGTSFKTPTNPNLTDDAVHDLVTGSVAPIPRVKVFPVSLRTPDGSKSLLAVRVGPNKRRAYAFARDFINHKERVAFKKHEVWIRRGATSGLASPEEIAALQSGQDLQAPAEGGPVDRVYGRMPYEERARATIADVAAADPALMISLEHQLAVVGIRGHRMVLRVLYSEEIPSDSHLHYVLQRAWGYEHGLLVLTPGRIPRKYFWKHQLTTPGTILDSKEPFGVYAQVPLPGSDPAQQYDLGLLDETFNKATRNGPPLVVPVFVLSGLGSTTKVLKKARGLVHALNEDGLGEQVLAQMGAIDQALESIVEHGRIIRDRARPPREAVADQVMEIVLGDGPVPVVDPDPNRCRIVEGEIYVQAAQSILDIAQADGDTLDPPVRVLGEAMVGAGADEIGQRMLLDELRSYDPEGYRVISRIISQRQAAADVVK